MKVTVIFDDNDHEYQVDFLKLAKKLNITEAQIKQVVQEIISKT